MRYQITKHSSMPWTRRHTDGIADAFAKIKAKIKSLIEGFKRLSTAKKVAITLASVLALIGGITAAIKAGRRREVRRLMEEANRRLDAAELQSTETIQRLREILNSPTVDQQQAAEIRNEITQTDILRNNITRVRREISQGDLLSISNSLGLSSSAANNNNEPINVRTKFKIGKYGHNTFVTYPNRTKRSISYNDPINGIKLSNGGRMRIIPDPNRIIRPGVLSERLGWKNTIVPYQMAGIVKVGTQGSYKSEVIQRKLGEGLFWKVYPKLKDLSFEVSKLNFELSKKPSQVGYAGADIVEDKINEKIDKVLGKVFSVAKSKGCLNYLVGRIYWEFGNPHIKNVSKKVASKYNIRIR